MGLEENLVFLVGEKVVFFRNDLVFIGVVRSRDFEKGDRFKEEMVVVVDVVVLVDGKSGVDRVGRVRGCVVRLVDR